MPPQKQVVLLSDKDPEELVLTFAGNVVKHLGVQMYSGRPVPAIAELVSNAWDADASTVNVSLPLGEAWDSGREDQSIMVEDDGLGMTWDMVRDAYLDVGRDRRVAEATDRSSSGRPLQGRKGIGKLAGFGIADVVEVQTVHEDEDSDLGERVLIWFKLPLDKLRAAKREPAPVEIIYAGPVSSAPEGGRKSRGTTVVLRQVHDRRAINASQFKRSIARRFLLLSQFRVKVNGDDLKEEDIELQWRWPTKGWEEGEVKGCGPVKYWIGFTEKPRKQSEGDLSGILIFSRGKVAQEATSFDISGGVTGQHGLRYMCGMIRAEWLDAGVDSPDLIATHRGSIAWESSEGQAFEEWGQALVKEHLERWAKKRAALREKQVTELAPSIKTRIAQLAPAYRRVADHFVDKFKSVEMEPGEFEEILSWFLDALENATLRRIIEKIRETDESDLEELDELLSKMEIRTALTLLQVIDSNLAAIESLKKMHLEDAKEQGVISKHLERNPWLIHPTWMLSKAEGRVATWIEKEFGLEPKGEEGDEDRADFFCVAVGGTLHIVEIKRGGHTAKANDILQAAKYRKYVLKRFQEITDPEGVKYGHVIAHLVSADLHADAKELSETYRDKGLVQFTTWSDLIERAEITHKQFQNALDKATKQPEEATPVGE